MVLDATNKPITLGQIGQTQKTDKAGLLVK